MRTVSVPITKSSQMKSTDSIAGRYTTSTIGHSASDNNSVSLRLLIQARQRAVAACCQDRGCADFPVVFRSGLPRSVIAR